MTPSRGAAAGEATEDPTANHPTSIFPSAQLRAAPGHLGRVEAEHHLREGDPRPSLRLRKGNGAARRAQRPGDRTDVTAFGPVKAIPVCAKGSAGWDQPLNAAQSGRDEGLRQLCCGPRANPRWARIAWGWVMRDDAGRGSPAHSVAPAPACAGWAGDLLQLRAAARRLRVSGFSAKNQLSADRVHARMLSGKRFLPPAKALGEALQGQ